MSFVNIITFLVVYNRINRIELTIELIKSIFVYYFTTLIKKKAIETHSSQKLILSLF